ARAPRPAAYPASATSPAHTIRAPRRSSSSRLPRRSAGSSPARTRTASSPARAATAAVSRAWLLCAAPVVTSTSAPAARASASATSSLRSLLPPPPMPARSSRLSQIWSGSRPRAALSRGAGSSGVGVTSSGSMGDAYPVGPGACRRGARMPWAGPGHGDGDRHRPPGRPSMTRTRPLLRPLAALATAALLPLAACSDDDSDGDTDGDLEITLRDAAGDRIGTIHLDDADGGGTEVSIDARDLPEGHLAFHVHGIGACEPDSADPEDPSSTGDFLSAGGHLGSDASAHG